MANDRQCDVFVLDSYESHRVAVKMLLENNGFSVHAFENSQVCRDMISSEEVKCDLLIMGLRLYPFGGLEFIKMLKAIRPSLPIIVVSACRSATVAVKALKSGIYDYIEKPVSSAKLISIVEKARAETSGRHLPVKSILSKTENKVLMQILDGKSTKEIALIRHRSIRTIEDQRSAIMRKLKVDNVVDLVKQAAVVIMPTPEI